MKKSKRHKKIKRKKKGPKRKERNRCKKVNDKQREGQMDLKRDNPHPF